MRGIPDMKEELIVFLNSVKQYNTKVLDTISKDGVEVNTVQVLLKEMPELIKGIFAEFPKGIYAECEEFFKSFYNFLIKCENAEFVVTNINMLGSSLELFDECIMLMTENCNTRFKICACCGNEVVYEPVENALCPVCSASESDRLILSFMKRLELDRVIADEALLQLAPTASIEHWIHGNCPAITYHSTKLCDSYDYWVYSNVIEHGQDDREVMRALYRVLKDDGIGMFIAPVTMGTECLEEAGFTVHVLDKEFFGEQVFNACGLTDMTTLYALTKNVCDINELISSKIEKRKTQVKPEPLVSVILPTYNHAEYVAEAIESVLNQTYINFEFIVADDGSTDGTQEVIKQYENQIDELHLFKVNTGNISKFLRAKARGKYIAMMHSDDVWALDKLEMQVAYMENHPECGACFTGCQCINENGEQVDFTPFMEANMTKEQWVRCFFSNCNCFAHPSILIHRDLYIQACENSGARMFAQLPDYWMWLNMLLEHEVHIIEKKLTFFRFHEGGKNKNTSARTIENKGRHLIEETYIWYDLFKKMSTEFFVNAFKDMLINVNATTDEEVLCEKMFVLLKHGINYVKQAGVFFAFDICQKPGMQEFLEEKYNWTKKDLKVITGTLLQ